MHTYQSTLRMRRSLVLLVAVVMAAWTMVFGLGTNLSIAQAGQFSPRSISLATSAINADDVTYSVSFTVATTGNVGGLIVDFCSNSPLYGETCTAPTDLDINESGPLVIASQVGVTDWTIDADDTDTNTLALDATSPASQSGVISFTMGSSGGSDGVSNGSVAGSFYARIFTYALATGNDGYTPVTSEGSYVDFGGVAMALTNPLQITAKVQEILQFCVGDTDADSASDCTDISGSSVYLGILDSSTVKESSTEGAAGDKNGYAMVRTNALSGVTISYIGATLTSGSNSIAAVGTTESAIVAGTTDWGMDVDDGGVAQVDTSNGTTSNLVLDTAFDTISEYTYAGSATTADTIATSTASGTKVVNDELLILDFGATVDDLQAPGIYTTQITFIANSIF